MQKLQCTDCLGIPQPAGQCLIPTDYLGAGANGFVVKVSDKSNNNFALKIVPIIVRPNEEKADKIKREKQFYQYLAKADTMQNLATATACWSIENVETSAYLEWSKALRKRFSTDALDYPSRVVKKTSGEFRLCVYFVEMKYYAAGNLMTWLQSNSDKCDQTYPLRIQLFCEILSAVNFLHERGLMHRDICPHNIFLTKDTDRLHAVLGDFDSIVSCGEQALWPLTKVRETFTRVLGTDPYAAPEIDGGDYDEQCDLFSLGVIALNLFFNIVDYNGLRNAIYKIREKTVFPTCIYATDASLWCDIVKAQLSGAPERRMTSSKLLQIMQEKEESLNVLAFETETKLKVKTHMSGASEHCERSSDVVDLVAADKATKEQSLYVLQHHKTSMIKLKESRSGWVELAQGPSPTRRNFGVAAWAAQLYVVGGADTGGGDTNTANASNAVQQYDTQTGWHDWPSMLKPRHNCGAAALGGRLFVVGGYDKTAEECDLETGRWAQVAPMIAGRNGVGVAALGNLLFAVGGGRGYNLKSAEWYDPRTGRWTKAALMHEPRERFGCAALGDRLYVAGGTRNSGEWRASVEWLDLRTGRWTRVRDMGTRRSDFALAALNGQLLAAGGWTSAWEELNTVEVYDEKLDAWSTLDVRLPYGGGMCVGCVVE